MSLNTTNGSFNVQILLPTVEVVREPKYSTSTVRRTPVRLDQSFFGDTKEISLGKNNKNPCFYLILMVEILPHYKVSKFENIMA